MKMALMFLVAVSANAADLADAVFKACGGENWPKVSSIQFTFNVSEGDKLLASAKHVWDVRAGMDAVTWKDKTVTVNVLHPGTDDDSKTAYARWVNDSYWLLAPLKLKDAGVQVTEQGEQDGLQVLHLSFAGVGLTPGDQYNLYIDPKTHLVSRWDYMPSPDKKLSGTWEGYRDCGGLKLATEHNFAGKRIWFSDIAVK
jgi:hypothetical protein